MLLKRFEKNYNDLDYLLGRCYFEKSKFEKAKQYLEDYVKNDDKFKEEAEYCLNIINNKNSKIQYVPIKILDHKINQEFRFHLSEFQKCKKSSENVTYDELKKILNDDQLRYKMSVQAQSRAINQFSNTIINNDVKNFYLAISNCAKKCS
jgi:transcriptional regulatory protein LevR